MNDLSFDTICADFEDLRLSDLLGKISELLHAGYLQESPTGQQKLIRGTVWSVNMRPVISLPVQLSEAITTMMARRPLNVHFLYLETSPQTYLSEEAMRALGLDDMVVVGDAGGRSMRLPLLLNGYKVPVMQSPAESHFAHLNILGSDFIRATGAQVWFGGDGKTAQFAISFP